jgi:hypothetical protein
MKTCIRFIKKRFLRAGSPAENTKINLPPRGVKYSLSVTGSICILTSNNREKIAIFANYPNPSSSWIKNIFFMI